MACRLYRFGDCTIDPAARELRRAGVPMTLSPKVFDCLAYLIEHRDRAVGRDELIAAVWGRVDVSDAVLGQTVLKARRVVADTGDEQNAIRTIPRFGYRWVAEVGGVEQRPDAMPRGGIGGGESITSTAQEVEQDTNLAKGHADVRKWIAWTVAGMLVLAVAWFVASRYRAASPSATESSTHASAEVIAVLPVIVEAGPEWSWLRLGLMDLVAAHLRNAGLIVVPSDNVVAATRTAGSDSSAMARLVREATGARQLIAPRATLTATGWVMHFDVSADGADREVESLHQDAVAAAHAAAAQLLDRLGRRSTADEGGTDALSLAVIQQRAEAALLSDDLVGARRIIEAAPSTLHDAPELRLRLVQVDLRAGQMSAARQKLDGLLTDVTAEANPVLRARVLTAVGTVALHTGDNAGAARACTEAVALLADRNQPAALGRAYTHCGIANASAGRFDTAMSDFARARIALEITGDTLALARVEANEAFMESTRGRYAEGVAIMRRSEERFQRFGARIEVVMSIRDQIAAHLALLQPAEALAASERGWAQLPQLENIDMRRSLQVQRARALAANGRIGEAVALLTVVANEATPGQYEALLGQTRATQAQLELAARRAETAIEHARAAVAALPSPDDARERAVAWLTLVRALHIAAKDADAAAEAQQFGAWSATTAIAAAPVYAALADAEQRGAARQDDTGDHYERALRAAEATGVPAEIVEVAVSWGSVLIDAGDLEHASAVIGRIARWAPTNFACSVLQARLYRALGRDEAWRGALQRARGLAGERVIPASANQSAGESAAPIASIR